MGRHFVKLQYHRSKVLLDAPKIKGRTDDGRFACVADRLAPTGARGLSDQQRVRVQPKMLDGSVALSR